MNEYHRKIIYKNDIMGDIIFENDLPSLQIFIYSKTCLKGPLKKRPKIVFQDQLSLNAGQKYCRMLQENILPYFPPSLSLHLSLRLKC